MRLFNSGVRSAQINAVKKSVVMPRAVLTKRRVAGCPRIRVYAAKYPNPEDDEPRYAEE